MPVFGHSPLSKAWNGLLEADRLNGGGIKPGGQS
jgi:hypothetical protein